jgi:hypothetical protein
MQNYWTVTHNNGIQYRDSGDANVDFFSKAGSMFQMSRPFYREADTDILTMFENSWIENRVVSMKLLLWLRDCRGGAGNRSGFRKILNWMALNHTEWVRQNIHWIPAVGRWDDLRALYDTPLEKIAGQFWSSALIKGDVLAAKWCDRSDYPVRKAMDLKIGDFRRFLAGLRKSKIVEHKMCSGEWDKIAYNTVPSVAMSRYTKAFQKNDAERFEQYKSDLSTGKETVKADVLFPHDCVRTANHGDRKIADAQFDALPNHMEDGEHTMVIADSSGSMSQIVGGQVRAIDVSTSMALYCSSKMPEESPFYKRFVAFGSEGELKDWRGMTFSQALRDRRIFDGYVGSTNIHAALDTILNIAVNKDIPQRLMPKTLLIVSDMQFDGGGVQHNSGTEVETALLKWNEAGYEIPKVVYWNTAGYAGNPARELQKDVGMVSGFSPSILKAVFKNDDFTPRGIMMKALEKYNEIVIPE